MKDKLNYMYEFAEDNNILVDDYKFSNSKKSMCMDFCDTFYIGIDYDKLESKTEELCVLAEEIAHYCVGITPTNPASNSYFNKLVRSRNEYRATRKAVQTLLDINSLKDAIDSGKAHNTYELAEMFNVTNEFMNNALKVYGFVK